MTISTRKARLIRMAIKDAEYQWHVGGVIRFRRCTPRAFVAAYARTLAHRRHGDIVASVRMLNAANDALTRMALDEELDRRF